MSRFMSIRLGAAMAILAGFMGTAEARDVQSSPFMAKGGLTTRPVGHQEFCKRHRSECNVKNREESRVHLTSARWNELVEVNNAVNWAILPVTDAELFGREEVWTARQQKWWYEVAKGFVYSDAKLCRACRRRERDRRAEARRVHQEGLGRKEGGKGS